MQRKPEPRKGAPEESGPPAADMAEAGSARKQAPGPPRPPEMPARSPRGLIRPFVFTVGVCNHIIPYDAYYAIHYQPSDLDAP